MSGTDLVQFIQEHTSNGSEDLAKVTAKRLLQKSLILSSVVTTSSSTSQEFDLDAVYYIAASPSANSSALNADIPVKCSPQSLSELGEVVRKLMLALYAQFLSEDGRSVDYQGIRDSPDFRKYKEVVRQLQNVKVAGTSREDRLAFFINIYNALVIHGFVERGSPPSNTLQRYFFFSGTKVGIVHGHVKG